MYSAPNKGVCMRLVLILLFSLQANGAVKNVNCKNDFSKVILGKLLQEKREDLEVVNLKHYAIIAQKNVDHNICLSIETKVKNSSSEMRYFLAEGSFIGAVSWDKLSGRVEFSDDEKTCTINSEKIMEISLNDYKQTCLQFL